MPKKSGKSTGGKSSTKTKSDGKSKSKSKGKKKKTNIAYSPDKSVRIRKADKGGYVIETYGPKGEKVVVSPTLSEATQEIENMLGR